MAEVTQQVDVDSVVEAGEKSTAELLEDYSAEKSRPSDRIREYGRLLDDVRRMAESLKRRNE